jgi:tyrosyl-tRNA synthetase
MNALLEDLKWRGLLYQSTDLAALDKRLSEGPVVCYCGFDPTADSLHVGHLVPILTLRRFARAGHKPIALVGGITGMIGDPKAEGERAMLSTEVVDANAAAQLKQLKKIVGDEIGLVNNADWLKKLTLWEFLRDIGKLFNVNTMLSKDSVTARMERETGISFTEFTYQTLQAYDFMYLLQTRNCELQVCGSDQWGNVTAGLDLIRKKLGREAFALSSPLVTKADGKKFGKSESGAVWLDPKKTSPYQFYQFWMNVEDSKAVEYLHYYTFKSREEVAAIAAEMSAHPETRVAQKALAEDVTTIVHGADALAQAIAASKALFGQAELTELTAETLHEVALSIPHAELSAGAALPDIATALVQVGLIDSKNAARTQIKAGGIYLNNKRVEESSLALKPEDFLHGCAILRKGKKSCGALIRA